jgi:outer membrane lipoprotein-sorting protein
MTYSTQFKTLLLGTVLATGMAMSPTYADLSILSKIDNNTNLLGQDLSMVATMITESEQDGVEKNVVRMFRRDEGDQFLILFQEPENMKGQGYLQVDETLWFYDPESRKFTHTSMKDSFNDSDANNSDFGTSNLAEDYKIVSSTPGQLGKFTVNVLELTANHDEVTYPSMTLWVNDSPALVLKSESYSLSNRLMRTSYYPSYTQAGNTYVASKMIFVDEVVEGDKTTVTFDKVSTGQLSDDVFTKAYVERVNK